MENFKIQKDLITNVLIIYTGGTIGMKKTEKGYIPAPNYMHKKLASLPQFHDSTQPELTTPLSRFGKRVHYQIKEYEILLDSSNMGMEDWIHIAEDIKNNYEKYDAFIILHGTDTMAYTASALSFMLENLSKTVILTGSQVPLSQEPNDAVDNLRGALIIAGHFQIPEVCLFFYNKLMRGNRTVKNDATSFDAFNCPNFEPLVKVGVNIKVSWEKIIAPNGKPFHVHTKMDPNGVLKLFPGITQQTIHNYLLPPMKGCVLETFGTGNAPDNRKDFLDELKEATDRGVVIVNITQCEKGMVECNYATGRALLEAGVISGYDMTTECALAKLSYLIGKDLSPKEIRTYMQKNLAGEVTLQIQDYRFSFQPTYYAKPTLDEGNKQNHLLPLLTCEAAARGDIDEIMRLMDSGASINQGDYDQRTPLHVAAAEGNLRMVQFLIMNGANVNALDRWGNTPLADAIQYGKQEVADFIKDNGGILQINRLNQLKKIVLKGNLKELKEILSEETGDASAISSILLHIAAAEGQYKIVEYLLQLGGNPTSVDETGTTPIQKASKNGLYNIVELLINYMKKIEKKKQFNQENLKNIHHQNNYIKHNIHNFNNHSNVYKTNKKFLNISNKPNNHLKQIPTIHLKLPEKF